ncbi:MAG TPA: HD domain-containing protein [Gemmatimonadota bacterium]|nr:HD domain-containing protein [Gemmatimonadota bacterium]
MVEGNGDRPAIDLVEVDAFAESAHAGQTRSTGEPYIAHPRAVRAILEDEFPEPVDDTTLAVALLHDVLEDCDVHPTVLLERWGRQVQEAVTLLSWNLKVLGIDRDERVYWSGIRRGPRAVRLVKAADRLHNVRETIASRSARMAERYLEETRAHLLPILREAGEAWFVERLEQALQDLHPLRGGPG